MEYFIKDYKYNKTKNQGTLNGKSYISQVFYKYQIIFLLKNIIKIIFLELLKYDTEITTLLNRNDETAREK